MTHQYTKLADELDAVNDVCGSRSIREAARILRAAAGVDVAGLMDVADRYALAQADPAHWRSALESALRLALAAREWQPIETAPKDGTAIFGLCRHDADPYYVGERLTDYGSRCEGLGHVPDGIHAICWEEAREESDGWEQPSYWIPAGWIHNADNELMANPTHWMPIPAQPHRKEHHETT